MEVSILIPVYNEIRFIVELCDCLDAQTFPPDQIEILFLEGGSTDGTRAYLEKRAFRATMRLIDNPRKRHVYALNIGLNEARGKYLLRMDGHGGYAPDYVEQCVRLLEADEDAINVGGVLQSRGYSFASSVIAKVMGSKFGLGGSDFRNSTEKKRVDTLFPGAWRLEQIRATGGWDETQLTSQDIEMSARFKRLFPGKYFLLDPAIRLWYYPRGSLAALAKQYHRYGYWRRVVVEKFPEMLRKSLFAPLLLFLGTFLGLIWTAIFAGIFPPLAFLGLLPLAAYLVYVAYASSTFLRGKNKKIRRFFYSIGALFSLHYPWALGFFRRLIESKVFKKPPQDIYG